MIDQPTKVPRKLPDDLHELLTEIHRATAEEMLATLRDTEKPKRASYLQAVRAFLADNGISAEVAQEMRDAAEEARSQPEEDRLGDLIQSLAMMDSEEHDDASPDHENQPTGTNDVLATPFD